MTGTTGDGLAQQPDGVQDIQIAGRVIVEEVALVEAVETLAGEVVGPSPERAEVELEPCPAVDFYDEEAEGEPDCEHDEDRPDAISRPGRLCRSARAPVRPAARSAA